jgi:hypothetical protein
MPARAPRFTVKPTLLAILLAFPAQQALATACTWNPASGNWATAGNWSCAIVPGINDDALIAAGNAVTIDAAQAVRNLNNGGGVNIDAFLLTLSGAGSTTNTGTINVGSASTAALQVSAGHNIANTGGIINIANGSVLNQFGSTITGGTISTTGTGKVVGFNDNSNFLTGVTLNGTLDLATGTGIERVTGGLTLNGAVNINNNSILSFNGDQILSGSGSIVLGNTGASNRALGLEGNTTLTIGSNIVVRGENGTLGQAYLSGGTQSLINNGRISADVSGGTFNLAPSHGVTNNGVLEAKNGGTLVLNANVTGTVGSHIDVGAGSTILQNGIGLNGVINTAGGGSFRAANSNSNTLTAATFNGTLDLATATGIERVAGGLTLNGAVNINNNSVLSFSGDQTLSGTGSIVLGNTGASNRALGLEGNATLTIGSNIVVRGENGTLGQAYISGGTQSLINNGRISADVSGGTFSLAPSHGVTNNGVLEAKNGGTLVLNANVTGTIGSHIDVGAGSTILQNGVGLNGVINTAGGGSFRAANSNANTLTAATFNGTLDLATATGIERVAGGLTLNGAVNINNNSVLSFSGDQTLSGTGSIVLGNTGASNRALGLEGNTTLTIGSNIVVRGENGTLGQAYISGGTQSLINNGRISADVSGGTFNLAPSHGVANNGVLEAKNGGTLVLNANVTGTPSGSIVAGAGSTVLQNGVTLSGTINSAGTGNFRVANDNGNVLSGVSFNGPLDLASATSVERVTGGLTLNGTISVNNNSVLSFNGAQTLDGAGTIVLGDTGASNRALALEGNTTLTVGSAIVVRGQNGTVGQTYLSGGTQVLVNNGQILADVGGGLIDLSAQQTNNAGTLGAANGGILRLNNNVTNSGSGHIESAKDSTVLQNGVIVAGGTINTVGTGRFSVSNSNGNVLSGVSLNGTIDLASATGIERVVNGLTLTGGSIVKINSNSVLSFAGGNQTLGGSGTIELGNTGASNRALSMEGNTTLTVGPNVLIHGVNGTIGQTYLSGGTQNLVNSGTINADGGGTIAVGVSGALTNDGLMRAQNGTLSIVDPLSGSGTLQVDSTGVMNLANSPNTQGKLLMGAAGSTLNIGTKNLTVNTDYTNAAAGTGNTFNRRAGISGAGQVVAGGDVAQAITGAAVTNGDTANATLTINNVRVGSTTYNYQVANHGTTGPALRGALQTNVNGANLTDARLSGAGVTASNYTTGGPGSNTGDLGVTFTAAAAGALAPLSGQVLNLRSNFENIDDQKLNVVLASGAAAYNAAVGSTTPAPTVTVANQHVGGAKLASLTVANTATAGAFSEDLNARFGSNTGAASNNGASINGLLAGANNSSAMKVGVDTTSAGAKTGTVTLNYETAGAVAGVSNGLGVAAANAPQVLNVSGNVYRLAQPNTIDSVNFGNVLFGSTQTRTLTVRNLAATDGFSEALNAAFGSIGGVNAASFSGAGGITGLLAGSSDSTSMVVTLNTGSTGTKTANVQILLKSNGDAIGNGLGLTDLGTQVINLDGVISGTVGNLATAGLSPTTVNFGKFREGTVTSKTQQLTVSNLTTGPGEGLNASFGAASGGASNNGGTITSLATAASNNTAMSATLNGLATAGAKSGTQTVNFVSDGSFNGGVTTPLPAQDVNLSADVYRLAVAGGTNAVNLAAKRVGDAAATGTLTLANTAAADGFSEGLRGSFGAAPAGFVVSGPASTALLAAGASEARTVSLSTATAGNFGGNVDLALVSNGAGTSGFGDESIGSKSVALAGKVYTAAVGKLATDTVDFGIVRVGDSVSTRNITVQNIADLTALNDTLRADLAGLGGALTAGGPVSGIAAGSSGTIAVALNTSAAGVFDKSGTVAFLSQNPDMADVSAGPSGSVLVKAQVNNLANADFDLLSSLGRLTQTGTSYDLDLGNIVIGKSITAALQLDNEVSGPADLLRGSFDLAAADDFAFTGWRDFLALGAGDALGGLELAFTAADLGLVEDSITFKGFGYNASDTAGLSQSRSLRIHANVVRDGGGSIPEPATSLLLTIALASLLLQRRRAMLH